MFSTSLTERIMKYVRRTNSRLFHDVTVQDMKTKAEHLVNTCALSDCDELMQKLVKTSILNEMKVIIDDKFIANPNVFQDVEFFERFTNASGKNKSSSVFDTIHECVSQGGKHVSNIIYNTPICDVNILENRVKFLQRLENIYLPNINDVQNWFETMKENEKHVVWLYEEKQENMKELYDLVFFRLKGLQPLNKSGNALTAYNIYRIFVSPIFGIVAPLIYFIIPYLIVMYRFKVRIPFGVYMKTIFSTMFNSDETMFGSGKHYKYLRIASYLFSAVFYFQGIFTSIDLSKTVHKISRLLVDNLHGAVQYLKAANKLSSLFWNEGISSYIDVPTSKLESIENETSFVSSLEDEKFSVLRLFGKQLKCYKFLNLEITNSIILKSYILDALLGGVRFKNNNKYAFAEFSKSITNPCVKLSNMVHPCINASKAVKNDVMFGDGYKQNAIITSPNSSGKSILIKSVIVNVLMAQTMGVSSCENVVVTPFRFINTQINVPDSTGHESLFEAEMHRCKHNLDMLRTVTEDTECHNKLCLIVMDEIFNSTNPIEAVAGAYAVCKRISEYQNNMLVFTTHFNYLTKLAKDPKHSFNNYRMETIVNENDVVFTYRLEHGVNKHLLALELLRKSGFEDSILDDAIKIKNSLVKPSKSKKSIETTKKDDKETTTTSL